MKILICFSNLRWLLLSLVVMILDLATKYLVMVNCVVGESIIISSFLNCYYIYNSGVAFSLFSGFSIAKNIFLLFIIILIILILLIMLYRLKSTHNYISKIAYAMVIGGALGNVHDRIYYGVVIDFIDFHIGEMHFPTCNIADLNIFFGTLLILYYHK